MRWGGVVLASVLGLAGASAGTQSPRMAFGLRAGRHDVSTRVILHGPASTMSIWYPARCSRRSPNPATPCRDAQPDSGRFPRVALVVTDRARTAADTATAAYLASHGYVVSAESDTALEVSGEVPFVDTALTARVELRPSGALLRAATAGRRLSVDAPRGRAIMSGCLPRSPTHSWMPRSGAGPRGWRILPDDSAPPASCPASALCSARSGTGNRRRCS